MSMPNLVATTNSSRWPCSASPSRLSLPPGGSPYASAVSRSVAGGRQDVAYAVEVHASAEGVAADPDRAHHQARVAQRAVRHLAHRADPTKADKRRGQRMRVLRISLSDTSICF